MLDSKAQVAHRVGQGIVDFVGNPRGKLPQRDHTVGQLTAGGSALRVGVEEKTKAAGEGRDGPHCRHQRSHPPTIFAQAKSSKTRQPRPSPISCSEVENFRRCSGEMKPSSDWPARTPSASMTEQRSKCVVRLGDDAVSLPDDDSDDVGCKECRIRGGPVLRYGWVGHRSPRPIASSAPRLQETRLRPTVSGSPRITPPKRPSNVRRRG